MARKLKRKSGGLCNARLGFLPKQKELNNKNIEEDYSVRCDTSWIKVFKGH